MISGEEAAGGAAAGRGRGPVGTGAAIFAPDLTAGDIGRNVGDGVGWKGKGGCTGAPEAGAENGFTVPIGKDDIGLGDLRTEGDVTVEVAATGSGFDASGSRGVSGLDGKLGAS